MVKQILFLFFIFLLLNSLFLNTTPVKADCVTNGLVLWLRFDEGSGNIAYDSSGYNNNAILYNNPTWVQGVYGYALKFNGVNQYGIITNNINLVQMSFSISMWINLAFIPSGDNPLLSQGTTVTDHFLVILVRSDKLYFAFFHDDLPGNTLLAINQWYFATFVYNYTSNTKQIYLNGKLDAQGASISYYQGSGPTYIGEYNNNISISFFNGTIDDVRIYNRALSQAEIQQIYLNTQPKFCQFTTSTTVYQNQIVQTNTAQGYNYFAIDPFNLGVLVLILVIGFLFFVFERRLILIGIGIGFLLAYFFLGINIGFVLLGFIFIILNIILIRRYE